MRRAKSAYEKRVEQAEAEADQRAPYVPISSFFIRGTIHGMPCEIDPKAPCFTHPRATDADDVSPFSIGGYCNVCAATVLAKALIGHLTKAYLNKAEKDTLARMFPEAYGQKRPGRPRGSRNRRASTSRQLTTVD